MRLCILNQNCLVVMDHEIMTFIRTNGQNGHGQIDLASDPDHEYMYNLFYLLHTF